MSFNTRKQEQNNKFNSKELQQKRRGRPKNDIGIAKPSTKKRGRPRKKPEKPPKPVGRNRKPKTTKEILEEEALAKKQAKEQEKQIRREALTAKQIEEKLKKERKIKKKIERKRLQSDEYSEYTFGAPREGHSFFTVKKLLLFLLIIALATSSLIVISWYKTTRYTEQKMKELSHNTVIVETKEQNLESKFLYKINFEELKSINKDAIAYIIIEGTNINYPVLQTKNNEYYSNHDIEKKSDESGAIYIDYKNNKRLTDQNTIIYGNYLKNEKMFTQTEKIVLGELGNDVSIEIHTPEKSIRFKVFSAYTTITEEDIKNNQMSEEEYKQYIETIKSKSQKEFSTKPDGTKQIITLSTYDKTAKKTILIHAVAEETEELEKTE